uniref:hypothetical protein n=1 Tax=Trichocoleus desertorum TaxID=1481672 RepID=UPI0025B5FC6A|nr:hypothetical protein [Trichocoleus desertorum]
MNLNWEHCLTVFAGLGCTVSITTMLAIALQSDVAPQRISISLGLPVVEAGTATELEVTTVALEPLQQSDLADVVWFQSLEPTVVSQRLTNLEELSLPDIAWESDLSTCSNVYNSKLTFLAACELEFSTASAPSISEVSAQFSMPIQFLGAKLLSQNPQAYQ